MAEEHCGSLRFFAENPGHARTGVEEDTDVENDVTVVGKELDGLWVAVFGDGETVLRKIADQSFFLVADGEIDGDEIDLTLEGVPLGRFVLAEGKAGGAQSRECENQENQGRAGSDTHRDTPCAMKWTCAVGCLAAAGELPRERFRLARVSQAKIGTLPLARLGSNTAQQIGSFQLFLGQHTSTKMSIPQLLRDSILAWGDIVRQDDPDKLLSESESGLTGHKEGQQEVQLRCLPVLQNLL